MRCPICEKKMEKWWIQHNKDWWTGEWQCDEHGRMKMSGIYKWGFFQERLHWCPACAKCENTENVVVTDQQYHNWICILCGRRVEFRNGRLISTAVPHLEPQPRKAAVIQLVGNN